MQPYDMRATCSLRLCSSGDECAGQRTYLSCYTNAISQAQCPEPVSKTELTLLSCLRYIIGRVVNEVSVPCRLQRLNERPSIPCSALFTPKSNFNEYFSHAKIPTVVVSALLGLLGAQGECGEGLRLRSFCVPGSAYNLPVLSRVILGHETRRSPVVRAQRELSGLSTHTEAATSVASLKLHAHTSACVDCFL
jgi:hypothetical protein